MYMIRIRWQNIKCESAKIKKSLKTLKPDIVRTAVKVYAPLSRNRDGLGYSK